MHTIKKALTHLIVYSLLGIATLRATPSMAGWSLNLGHHNPPGALVGINALYYANSWGFELGLGWLDLETTDSDDKGQDKDQISLHLGGDANFKLFLGRGTFKPYLQAGFGISMGTSAGKQASASAGTGGPFAGIGILMGSSPIYAYLAYNIASSAFLQAGVGFDL